MTILPAHGGYRQLKSFQSATIVYDFTVNFCSKYINSKSRTIDQMVQAARSGKQNIAEASQASGTSKKTELHLLNVARSSQEELLQDYEDFLRQSQLKQWPKFDPQSQTLRSLGYTPNRSYTTYLSYMSNPESAANCALTLVHQTNYLLDQQIRSLENKFVTEGGLSEKMYKARTDYLKSHQK